MHVDVHVDVDVDETRRRTLGERTSPLRVVSIALLAAALLAAVFAIDPCRKGLASHWRLPRAEISAVRAREDIFIAAHPPPPSTPGLLAAITRFNLAEWKARGDVTAPDAASAAAQVREAAAAVVAEGGSDSFTSIGLTQSRAFAAAFRDFSSAVRGVGGNRSEFLANESDGTVRRLAERSGSFAPEAIRTGLLAREDDEAAVFVAESLFLVRWLSWVGGGEIDRDRRFAIAAWKAEAHPDLPPGRRMELLEEARSLRPDYFP